MQYPNSEDTQIALAARVANGLADQTTLFPAPPVAPTELQTLLTVYQTKRQAADAAVVAAQMATHDKDEALAALNAAVKTDLRYAENTVNFNNQELELIGWGGRAAPTRLQPPGQCRALETVRQGDRWVYLDWKEPGDGGKVAAYKIQRSNDGAAWSDAATSIESEYTLHDQPSAKNLLYRVLAINKAGEGLPSNTVNVSF